jgi:hypothetical protein
MGLAVVALFWLFFGAVAATIGSVVLRAVTTRLTRNATGNRSRLLSTAILLPYACLARGAAIFVAQSFVNERYFHRDPGIGDSWKCPLPNGYAMEMIDVPDHAWIYKPATQPSGSIGSQDDTIAGVQLFQVAGQYLAGGTDDSGLGRRLAGEDGVDSYFLWDTVSGTRKRFANVANLRSAMSQLGLQLSLEPVGRVYRRYRYTWFDNVVSAAIIAPVLLGLGLLGVWILRVRRGDGALNRTSSSGSDPRRADGSIRGA